MKKFFLIAAAMASLVACSKENEVNNDSFEKGQKMVISVSAGVSSKVSSALNTSTGDVDFKWAADDKIKLTVGTASSEFDLLSGDGTGSALFYGVMPAKGSTFDIQYPVTDPDLTAQTFSTTETLPHGMVKFAATGCSTSLRNFSLSPQCAALQLNLYAADQSISKIVVTNTSSAETPKPTYTLTINGGIKLPTTEATAQAFYIVVPAGNYAFTAEVFDNSTTPVSLCTFEKLSATTFQAGQLMNMPAKAVKKIIPGSLPSIAISPETAW